MTGIKLVFAGIWVLKKCWNKLDKSSQFQQFIKLKHWNSASFELEKCCAYTHFYNYLKTSIIELLLISYNGSISKTESLLFTNIYLSICNFFIYSLICCSAPFASHVSWVTTRLLKLKQTYTCVFTFYQSENLNSNLEWV